MATRTATRRKPPPRKAPRSVTITLGGPKPAATPKRRSRPTTRRAGIDSLGWRITEFVGKHTWRGVVVGSRWTAQHGKSATVRSAKAMGAPVKAWAEDYRAYGRIGHADCACGWRGPTAQLRDHMAQHTGDTPEQRPQRPSGDAVRAGEAGPIRATATRLDRQPDGEAGTYDCRHCDWSGPPHEFGTHVVACPGLGRVPEPTTGPVAAESKEIAVSKEMSALENLLGYEPESAEQIPEDLRAWAADLPPLAEGFTELSDKAKEWNVHDPAPAKFAEIAHYLTAIEARLKEVTEVIEGQLEHQITTKKAG
jgi:hypothetical protein